VPFLALAPNFGNLEIQLKRVFGGCSLVYAVSSGSVILLQLFIDENDRVALSTALFVLSALMFVVVCIVLAIGGHKVAQFCITSRCCLFFALHHGIFPPAAFLFNICTQLLALIDQSQNRAMPLVSMRDPLSQESDRSLRYELLRMIVALEILCSSMALLCLGVLFIPTFRDRTWLVWPALVIANAFVSHIVIHLLPSVSRKISIESGPHCSPLGSLRSHKISPAIGGLLNPVAVLARSQLAVAELISNKGEFCPPQDQPRAKKLKWVADLLQGAMFKNDNGGSTMNETVVEVIEGHFIPAAQAHFAECVEQARDMVPEIRDRYHNVRKGHLAIYQDTLDQIRGENAFTELQKRSDKLVKDCEELNRPKEQKVTSICDLYNGAEAVFKRYDALIASVASKTATKFHPAPRKGLLRICEKLALASEWRPERILDVTRGLHRHSTYPRNHIITHS
jgi:hypothetical protein